MEQQIKRILRHYERSRPEIPDAAYGHLRALQDLAIDQLAGAGLIDSGINSESELQALSLMIVHAWAHAVTPAEVVGVDGIPIETPAWLVSIAETNMAIMRDAMAAPDLRVVPDAPDPPPQGAA
jgi:hypothetical protein